MRNSTKRAIHGDKTYVRNKKFIDFYNQFRDPSLDYRKLNILEAQIIENLKKIGEDIETDEKYVQESLFLKEKMKQHIKNSNYKLPIYEHSFKTIKFSRLDIPFNISNLSKCAHIGVENIYIINNFSEQPPKFNLSPEELIKFLVPNYFLINTYEKQQEVKYPNLSSLMVENNSESILVSETYQLKQED